MPFTPPATPRTTSAGCSRSPAFLLSGYYVIDGSTVVIRRPDGDMAAYLDSLDRLLRLDPPLAAIAPGHGRLIDEPAAVVRGIVAHRLAREDVVAGVLAAAGRATVDELLPAVYADVDRRLFPVARNSLWAHLRKLAADGRATAPSRSPGDPTDGDLGDPADGDERQIDGVWSTTPTTRR